ncbi:MAG: hypothetical protein NTZ55_02005 [Candidatus Roizmanbacteria bacterium]|nr:hypothetical protein [Candidatus Roizmanbacteria bacterium]
MKIFFTASQRGKKQFGNTYKKIQSVIAKSGYTVLEDDIFSEEPEDLYRALESGDHKKQTEFYNKKIETLQKADLCIFEASTHSLSIGFVIQKALEFNKPTIVLYLTDYKPLFFSGVDNDKLILQEYDEKNFEKQLGSAIQDALHLREKRFNFFISPGLLSYLEHTSKKEGVTKSTFIRNLLLAHRKKFS